MAEFPCDYCGEPAYTTTRFGGDQACFECAVEADAEYAASFRGQLEELATTVERLGRAIVEAFRGQG